MMMMTTITTTTMIIAHDDADDDYNFSNFNNLGTKSDFTSLSYRGYHHHNLLLILVDIASSTAQRNFLLFPFCFRCYQSRIVGTGCFGK